MAENIAVDRAPKKLGESRVVAPLQKLTYLCRGHVHIFRERQDGCFRAIAFLEALGLLL